MCQKCGALVWYGERSEKKNLLQRFQQFLCCMKGNDTIPYMIDPPDLLSNLFSGIDPRSGHFLSNIRSYNNMFSFTSLGGKIQTPQK
jgi:hypothetical protein